MESQKPNYLRPRPIGATTSCRKHPNHRQSPGVCSLCLFQKLADLSNGGAHVRTSPPSSHCSSSSSYISSLSSSCSSPTRVSVRRVSSQNHHALAKSRSMAAFVPHRHRPREADANGNKIMRIKRGFWSKLLRKKSKSKELIHSRTINGRLFVK